MLCDHIMGLMKDSNEAFGKLLLLKTVITIYPVLADLGAEFDGILLIASDSERAGDVIPWLKVSSNTTMLSLGSSPKEVRKALSEMSTDNVLVLYAHSRYTRENTEYLLERCAITQYGDQGHVLFAVLADSLIPEELQDLVSGCLFLTEVGNNFATKTEEFEIDVIGAIIKWQEILRLKIEELSYYEEPGIAVFEAAALFLGYCLEYEGVSESERVSIAEKLERTLEVIRDEWEPANGADAYVEKFRVNLFTMVDRIPGVVDRRHVEGEALSKIDTVIFFDDLAYYLPYELFCEVCKAVQVDVSIQFLKHQLISAGLLACEGKGRNYATPKVVVVTTFGVRRFRRVKIWRSLIDKVGEISFAEYLQMGGGEL